MHLIEVLCFSGQTMWYVGILVPQPGMEPMPPAGEARSLNHGATREVPAPATFSVPTNTL